MAVKRALLVGSPYAGLRGTQNDVDDVERALEARGFCVDCCAGPAATRDGIKEACARLAHDTAPGDAVVVYYSGHGGIAVSTAPAGRAAAGVWRPWRHQFLVPVDFDDTTDDDFRGIASIELARWLAGLTARTRNVTVLLDCCHAARMARDFDLSPKALPRVWYRGVQAHVERLRSAGVLSDEGGFAEGNPDVVRLVASATDESAYEYTNAAGRRVGVFTEALCGVLKASEGYPAAWRSVLVQVRERTAATSRQRPEAEGSSERVMFELAEADMSGALAVRPHPNNRRLGLLDGGRLAGAEEDDVYTLMRHGSDRADASGRLGEARVVLARAGGADVELSFANSADCLPQGGAMAFPESRTLRRRPVVLVRDLAPEFAASVRAEIEASPYLRVWTDPPDSISQVGGPPVLATVRPDPGGLVLVDFGTVAPCVTAPSDRAGVRRVVRALEKWARALEVLALADGRDDELLKAEVTMTLWRVGDGVLEPLAGNGRTLLSGEAIGIMLRNEGGTTVYASVFDVGVTGNVGLLSQSAPSGIQIAPGHSYVLGQEDATGEIEGCKLTWPVDADMGAPFHEHLVAIFTNLPTDLRALETGPGEGALRDTAPGALPSGFARLVQATHRGHPTSRSTGSLRFAVRQAGFILDPAATLLGLEAHVPALRLSQGDYPVDARQDSASPSDTGFRHVALRLNAHGSEGDPPPGRLDWMTLLAARPGGGPGTTVFGTTTLEAVAAAGAEGVGLFDGRIDGTIDVAVWLSDATKRNVPSLSELVVSQVGPEPLQALRRALAASIGDGADRAATVLAGRVSATIAGTCAGLLAERLGAIQPIYRAVVAPGLPETIQGLQRVVRLAGWDIAVVAKVQSDGRPPLVGAGTGSQDPAASWLRRLRTWFGRGSGA